MAREMVMVMAVTMIVGEGGMRGDMASSGRRRASGIGY